MIEAVEVERDKEGGFTHPDWDALLSAWGDGEHIPIYFVNLWGQANGCSIVPVTMEHTDDTDGELWTRYDDGSGSYSDWPPHPPSANAVLVSIHDSEDGPVQLWAVPDRPLGHCRMPPLERARLVTGHAVDASGRGDMGQAVIAHGGYSPGGAQNHYVIGVGAEVELVAGGAQVLGCVSFQDGSPQEHGPNGVTLEALLAVCADRLARFQEGPHANGYNAEAKANIERALEALKDRTRERDQGGR